MIEALRITLRPAVSAGANKALALTLGPYIGSASASAMQALATAADASVALAAQQAVDAQLAKSAAELARDDAQLAQANASASASNAGVFSGEAQTSAMQANAYMAASQTLQASTLAAQSAAQLSAMSAANSASGAAASAAASSASATAADASKISAAASASTASTKAAEALASEVAAEIAKDDAVAAAGAIGPIDFYGTHALATAALGSLVNGDLIEVAQDETRSGARTRYVVSGGVLVFAVNLDQVRLDIANSADPAKGAALVGFLPAGTGAVARNVRDKLRETVSVRDFGAVGDGVTDDTAAIQAAIDANTSSGFLQRGQGNIVYLPKGIYRVSSPITVKRGVTLLGAGGSSSCIEAITPLSFDVLRVQDEQAAVDSIYVRNGDIGINMLSSARFCTVKNCWLYGNRVGIKSTDGYINTVIGCKFNTNACGMVILGQSYQLNVTDCVIDNNCYVVGSRGGCGVFIHGSSGVSLRDCTIEGNRKLSDNSYGVGVYIKGQNQRTAINACWFEANGGTIGSHVVLEGGNSNTLALVNGLIDNCLPSEHPGTITNDFTGNLTINDCFFFFNTSHGVVNAGTAVGSGTSTGKITVNGGAIVPTSTSPAKAFWVPMNSGNSLFSAVGVSVVSTSNLGFDVAVLSGLQKTPVHTTTAYASTIKGAAFYNGKDVAVVTLTRSQFVSILGGTLTPPINSPFSGNARFYRNLAHVGSSGDLGTTTTTGTGLPRLDGAVAPDYFVLLAGQESIGAVFNLIGGGNSVASVVSGADSVVLKYSGVYAHIASTALCTLNSGTYYGYAGFSQAAFDAVFNGARFLSVSCELSVVPPTASSIPSLSTKLANLGDIVYNSSPAAGGNIGWVCTAAGAPGTWKTFGAIAV